VSNNRVGLLVAVTIFVMAVVPLPASFYLLDEALRTSLDLGFNPQIVRTLNESAANLRDLARLDETGKARYRAQFEEIQALRQVYSEPELVKRSLKASLKWYFGLGLGAVLLLCRWRWPRCSADR
jgi:hypothetical protein